MRTLVWGLLGLAAACGRRAEVQQVQRPGGEQGHVAEGLRDEPRAATLVCFTFEEPHFGEIPVELTLWATDEAHARGAADAAFARVAALAAQFSDYALDPPSALNRIAERAPEAVDVPSELALLLVRAKELGVATGGAFDVTAKPLVQLWRVSRRLGELPPQQRIAEARTFVDLEALEVDLAAGTARLARAGMWLDLGGIAKGAIGDEVVRVLGEAGVPRCKYAAGGDMVFGDPPPGAEGWDVVVPDVLVGGEALSFRIANGAASVSGDVHRFVEIDGVRYSHVVDPRTGLGVTGGRAACVRGLRGVDTDALATAGVVLDDAAWAGVLARVPGAVGVRSDP